MRQTESLTHEHGVKPNLSGFVFSLSYCSRCHYLNGVLDLLLEVAGDVVAVSNVPDARQRHTGSEGLCEAGQPAQGTSLFFFLFVTCIGCLSVCNMYRVGCIQSCGVCSITQCLVLTLNPEPENGCLTCDLHYAGKLQIQACK